MAKLKLKKLPKKPKTGASVATMETWLKKVADIKSITQTLNGKTTMPPRCVKKLPPSAVLMFYLLPDQPFQPNAKSNLQKSRNAKAINAGNYLFG